MATTQRFGRARLLSLLEDGRALTPQQAAQDGWLTERQARNILRELHGVERKTYISAWRRDASARRWTAEYKLGQRADAPKPNPLSTREKSGRYRARLRLDDERKDFVRGARGTPRRIIRQDPLAMALLPWLYTEGARGQLVVTAPSMEAATTA